MRFVLIHGGFHGAWCWTKLIPEIERLGHEALAIDLPGHGERRDEASTLALRRDAIVDVLRSGDVLVGHSGGGFDMTLAANAAPERIAHMIYLAAGLPLEGRPLVEATGGGTERDNTKVARLNETIPATVLRPDSRGWLEWVDKNAARALFYHDCDDETVSWAFARLSPAPPEILLEPVSLARFWSAELPRSYIICREDHALPFATAMKFAGRLGVAPFLIDGSHSPFLSRPRALAELFLCALSSKPVAQLKPD